MIFGITCIRIEILICFCIKRNVITLELLEYSWVYIFVSIGLWAKRLFLLRYGSRDTRRIDFSRVDGLSTDTPVLGRHSMVPEPRFINT